MACVVMKLFGYLLVAVIVGAVAAGSYFYYKQTESDIDERNFYD